MFLKNIALYGVNDLFHVMNSDIETKNHLRQLVENGIKDKTVSRLHKGTPSTSRYDKRQFCTTVLKIDLDINMEHYFYIKKVIINQRKH